MAQKKASSGRSGTKKPASTARKSTSTKKKTTASSRGGASTKKKAPARSNTGRSASGSRTNARAKTPPRQPVRRQVGCGILLVLGIIAAIGWFPVDAWLVAAIRRFVMGLTGWGYYIMPVCLLWGAYILGFHRGRPVALRVTCVLLLPLVFGAFIHALLFPYENLFTYGLQDGFKKLWNNSQYLTEHCGGVLGGLVGLLLKKSIGLIGSFLLLVVAFTFLLLEGMNMSVADLIDRMKQRPHLVYEPTDDPDELTEDDLFSPDDYLFPLDDEKPARKPKRTSQPTPKPAPPPAFDPEEEIIKARRRRFYDQSREEAKDELFAEFDVDPADAAKVAAALDARQAAKIEKPAQPKKQASAPKAGRKSPPPART